PSNGPSLIWEVRTTTTFHVPSRAECRTSPRSPCRFSKKNNEEKKNAF
ncbi:unnamed protein product, partial [Ectocarpus sp. 12 AP-2014]